MATKAKAPRRDVEAEITARVIEALEGGTVPWSKPWTAAGLLPTSFSTGRAYRGINVWLLSMTAAAKGYGSPYWLTYRQAEEHGGNVRKGEKGTLVVFWKILKVADKDPAAKKDATKNVPLMRHYVVFNLEQTENVAVPPRFAPVEQPEPPSIDEAVGEVLAGYVDGPSLRHVISDRAYYSPSDDAITLPEQAQFATGAGYASTLFHELTHSTGHPSRLDRFVRDGEPQHFGSEKYAREELVAEMGAAMLGAITGVDTQTDQNAAYVANWLGALKGDKSLVVSAAQKAQKAVDRIMPVAATEAGDGGQEQAA